MHKFIHPYDNYSSLVSQATPYVERKGLDLTNQICVICNSHTRYIVMEYNYVLSGCQHFII